MNPSLESSLHQSWHDPAWIPILNPANVMDYFSERSNPFYNRQCNNEVIKMQRLSMDQLPTMTGLEYVLLHAQDPILYIIRLQMRHPNNVIAIADYYIVAGVVYQAPDLSAVINSRMLNSVHNLESAFEEAQSFSRYHPSKGYSWEFKDQAQTEKLLNKEKKKKKKEEPSSLFQRQRVDLLLADLAQRFPPKVLPPPPVAEKKEEPIKSEVKVEVKTEKGVTDRSSNSEARRHGVTERSSSSEARSHGVTERSSNSEARSQGSSKPPPEKKPKLMRN